MESLEESNFFYLPKSGVINYSCIVFGMTNVLNGATPRASVEKMLKASETVWIEPTFPSLLHLSVQRMLDRGSVWIRCFSCTVWSLSWSRVDKFGGCHKTFSSLYWTGIKEDFQNAFVEEVSIGGKRVWKHRLITELKAIGEIAQRAEILNKRWPSDPFCVAMLREKEEPSL